MSESEIQPLITLIRRSLKVHMLLLLAHGAPLLLPSLVTKNIVNLRKDKQHKGENTNADEHAVSAEVTRFVVFAVDVGCDHAAQLDTHIVASGGDGARAHAARVA